MFLKATQFISNIFVYSDPPLLVFSIRIIFFLKSPIIVHYQPRPSNKVFLTSSPCYPMSIFPLAFPIIISFQFLNKVPKFPAHISNKSKTLTGWLSTDLKTSFVFLSSSVHAFWNNGWNVWKLSPSWLAIRGH